MALRFATVRVPVVPLSTKVSNVFGLPAESFIVKVALVLLAPRVTIGEGFERVSGEAPDNVTTPFAVILVALLIAPVFVIPPLLLFIPPVIFAPPEATVKELLAVRSPAEVMVPVPVVEIFPLVERVPFSFIVNLSTPPD